MRWENLSIDQEERATLPGFRDPAVVRNFDAPEAMGINFYEVRARSAINEVPKRSRMPFRFTINPYRGCSHACVYCLGGETPILMADGRTKALAEVQIGDTIYGTVPDGSYRRYVTTSVHAHWATRKDAYRITLEDGTELIASGDHRFLSNRGWKFVTGTEQGSSRRPHLTPNNKLLGVGRMTTAPEQSSEFRRGYLCGMVRGDGQVGTYSYDRRGRRQRDVHRFRLALTDLEALWRTREYLAELDVLTSAFAFQAASGARRALTGIRTAARDEVAAIRDAIRWPRRPDAHWRRGFLAGIFDAEGSYSQSIVRISNTDPEIIDWTTCCLRHVGFNYVIEDPGRPNGLRCIRLRGGLREHLRFFQTVDPAITRKRAFRGVAVKGNAKLGVVSIEPLGERELFDITTGTGDFIANGVISHNCFARPTHTYLDFNAREDFERQIVVKVNVPELVRAELARPSWNGDHVALGTNTDPYQWVEGRYRLMPGIWEAMRDAANPCSVLTKSPLLLRDLELMRELTDVTDFGANLSVPTLDEKAWRETEPHTPHPRKRLEAVGELNDAGIPAGILIAPLMPGINDRPEQVEEILELAGEARAVSVGGVGLHLRGELREIFFDWLRQYRPDLISRYEELYEHGAYMRRPERDRLSELARVGAGPPGRFRGLGGRGKRGDPVRKADRGRGRPERPRQSSLF